MATIKVQAQGVSTEVTVDNANVQDVLDVFERMTNKSLKGMEAYVNGSKAADDASVQDGDRVTFIQSKHASAAKIKVQAAGMSTEVEISDDCDNLEEILETFERLTRKSLKGMDAFVNGKPMEEGYQFQDEDRIAFSQSKHASAK